MVENNGGFPALHSIDECDYAIENGFSVSVPNKDNGEVETNGGFPVEGVLTSSLPWVNKREAFIEKAVNRTNNAVRYIRSIGNLSSVKNQQRYEWSEQDVKEIFKFIESEVRLAKKKMMLNDSLPRPFKLD